ncbi:MAG: DoxX family membrane protein [Desulfobacterales bacterium]|nr:DoxX family membrane protein [Desulfobacterales bacterium]
MKFWEFAKKIPTSKYLALILRIYIGWIFIYASMYKINYAGEFAESIASYQLVPFWAVNIMAVFLPWTELICGLLLIAGIRSKAAALLIASMLVVFIIAIGINLIRGTPIGCGCFSSVEEPLNWVTLFRDIIWLAMTIHVYIYDTAFHLEKKFFMKIRDL